MSDQPRYVLYPLAEQDLSDIWLYGAEQWGPRQADAYLDRLLSLFDLLGTQPDIARLREEFSPPVHIHPHGSHAIVYRKHDLGIAIIRLLHNRQDILAVLEE